jgi:hypothetical protein
MMKTPKSKSRFRQSRTNDTSDLRPINPNAAGIDIGSEFHACECSIHIEHPRV